MIKLYHAKAESLDADDAYLLIGPPGATRLGPGQNTSRAETAATLFAARGFELVAECDLNGDAFALGELYRLTQNGVATCSWSRRPPFGLRPLEPTVHLQGGVAYGRRSTMAGDVLEVTDDAGQVTARYVVDWIGFAPMPLPANTATATAA